MPMRRRFQLLSFPLCVREACYVGQVSCALPGRLMHVDGRIPALSFGAWRTICAAVREAGTNGEGSLALVAADLLLIKA